MTTDSHDSDCATHNAPAYPSGPCDCATGIADDAFVSFGPEGRFGRSCGVFSCGPSDVAANVAAIKRDKAVREWKAKQKSDEVAP